MNKQWEVYSDAWHKEYEEYKKEFASWDWDAIAKDCKRQAMDMLADPNQRHYMLIEWTQEDTIAGAFYLGKWYALCPSGKYYMPWCTNQTDEDVFHDSAYSEALSDVAEEHACYVICGEGDSTDTYIAMSFDWSAILKEFVHRQY